ncbi:hypothetical protein AAFF_G00302430 [Aldrovandia affinis]|uniref:Uncharacterized protein n=1 Tax=Aldrovandia affinis TaxID=143900 RepID=A0AAD7R8J7_9TELE|nr:hypothetical protein AAFF_G00302430 [Aldrovandia affinis]
MDLNATSLIKVSSQTVTEQIPEASARSVPLARSPFRGDSGYLAQPRSISVRVTEQIPRGQRSVCSAGSVTVPR